MPSTPRRTRLVTGVLGFLFFSALWLAGLAATAWAAPRPDRKTQNVILVTTDGLRWQEVFGGADEALMNKENGGVDNLGALKQAFWRETPQARREALLPFFWTTLAKHGQLFGNVNQKSEARVTNGLNFSYPGYNEMLTGAPDPAIDSNDKRPNPNTNVLEWLNRQPRYRGHVAAFCSWDCFPYIINRERSGVFVNAGWEPLAGASLTSDDELFNRLMVESQPPWEGARYDAFTFYPALEYLRRNKPRVLYVAFDETDDWAHAGRYDRYLQAARRVDVYIKKLWDTAQSLPGYRGSTSLVITTDHGRGDPPKAWRDHNAKTPGSEYIWIAVLGPDTPALGERTGIEPVTQSQVAATVAALLGEDYSAAAPKAAKPIAGVIGKPASSAR